MPNVPLPPLPEPMTGVDPDSWAYDTVMRRWPETGRKILSENVLSKQVAASLEALIREIPDRAIATIVDPGAPDIEQWDRYVNRFGASSWLTPPWFFGEHYFYRRVMAVIGHFQPGPGKGLDPFVREKRRGLEVCEVSTRDLAAALSGWNRAGGSKETLLRMFYLDLWGNQADLSLWPADGEVKPDHGDMEDARGYLLVDEAEAAAELLMGCDRGTARVDILVDNAGFELVSDLALADHLLSCERVRGVRLHVKSHPTYVSDATPKDVMDTLLHLSESGTLEVRALGRRLTARYREGRLQVADNFFWTSPLPAWEMPAPLREELAGAVLVVSKGDAHYRRLLGDLDWSVTTPFADITAYFPAPLLALRTLKSELACGMAPGQVEEVTQKDPEWMTNGRWGMAQLA